MCLFYGFYHRLFQVCDNVILFIPAHGLVVAEISESFVHKGRAAGEQTQGGIEKARQADIFAFCLGDEPDHVGCADIFVVLRKK